MDFKTTLKGNWHEIKGIIRTQWGRLTDDEIEKIDGSREKLIGELMAKYQMSEQQAEEQVKRYWP